MMSLNILIKTAIVISLHHESLIDVLHLSSHLNLLWFTRATSQDINHSF